MPKSKKKTSSPSLPQKEKLRTAGDVIQRLRWDIDDPRFQYDDIAIGYKDSRFVGDFCEWELKTFKFFKEGGDIPEHRILFIRDNDRILWKKSQRYDIVFNSGRTQKIIQRKGELLWDGKLPKKKKEFRTWQDPDSEDDLGQEMNEETEVFDPLFALAENPHLPITNNSVEFEAGMKIHTKDGQVGVLERFIHKTQRWRIRDNDGGVFKAIADDMQIAESAPDVSIEKPKSSPKRKRKRVNELINFRKACRFPKARSYYIDETLEIMETGEYSVDERDYDIRDAIQAAKAGSEFIPSGGFQRNKPKPLDNPTRFLHVNHSTLQCIAYCQRQRLKNPFVLNFASAKNVGGGWRKGALAQEEAICRCSALDACLQQFHREYYDFHRRQKNLIYSHRMIYSPKVPVFRNDFLDLHKPMLCSFLTSAAPNKKAYLRNARNMKKSETEVQNQMYERCRRVLYSACRFGHDTLILGAWGCGVFGHERVDVGRIWAELFDTEFRDVFDTVIFAHLIWQERDWNGFRYGLTSKLVIEEMEFRDCDVTPWTRIEWGAPQRSQASEHVDNRRRKKKGKRGRNY